MQIAIALVLSGKRNADAMPSASSASSTGRRLQSLDTARTMVSQRTMKTPHASFSIRKSARDVYRSRKGDRKILYLGNPSPVDPLCLPSRLLHFEKSICFFTARSTFTLTTPVILHARGCEAHGGTDGEHTSTLRIVLSYAHMSHQMQEFTPGHCSHAHM